MKLLNDRIPRLSTELRFGSIALTVASGLIAFGCWAANPCEPGQTIRFDSCFPAPEPSAHPKTDAGLDGAAGEGGKPLPTSFGQTCAQAADCAPGSPVCGAPQLPYCTQIHCLAGEENADACPRSGWQCLKVGNNPSVCLKTQ